MQGRRVELHELEVGHGRAGRHRHGDTVAGGQRRIGRHRIQLPGAAAGQDDVAGPHHQGGDRVGRQPDHARHPSAFEMQRQRQPAFVHGHVRVADGGGDQGPLDLVAGGVAAGVDDPGQGVAAFPGQRQGGAGAAVAEPVEGGAQGHQFPEPGRALADEDPHRFGVAQPAAGRERVGEVQLGRVVGRQRRRHAALGVAGGRCRQLALGQHGDGQPGLGRGPGGGEAGDARAEDQDVDWGQVSSEMRSNGPSGPVTGASSGRAPAGCGRRRGRWSA